MDPSPATAADCTNAERLREVVADALELPTAERPTFLVRACGDDPALLAEARSLLGHAQDEDDFLAQPAYALAEGAELGSLDLGEMQPGDTLGDYRILGMLGEGGMGEVYLAEDLELERRVAIKLLKHRADDRSLGRRFRHEQKVLAGLTHPNIARLYGGATTPEGRSYLVMEYIEGERLDRYCDRRKLPVGERLALFRKVCAAVAYAHQNLVVHRDLKPANIRVTPEGEPKLLDFGIAKLLGPENATAKPDLTQTLFGAAMTPEYASPEQLRGEPITTATDVYSLGVILYELLCGQRPYALKGRRPDEVVRAICEQNPVRPSTIAGRMASPTAAVPDGESPARLRRRLEGDLDNIVAKALSKEPARRYGSVAGFSEDIRRHCEGLPVTARPDTFGYRVDKFIRRNKVGVTAAALVVLAMFVGLAATTWQARVARQERDRARISQRQAEIAKKQAQRLNGFLENLLGSADPAKMGKDVKVAQVLDAAGQSLDRELADEPEILVQAHDTLRRVYDHLGLYASAEHHARAILDLDRRLHGDDDPTTAKAEYLLADTLGSRYQHGEAEPLLRHALAVQRRQLVPDHAALADTLSALSFGLAASGRPDEAEPFAQEAISEARRVGGERNQAYLTALNELGAIKESQRDYAAAATIFSRLLRLNDEIDSSGLSSLAAQINLLICLYNEEKLDEAAHGLIRLDGDVHRLMGKDSVYLDILDMFHGCLEFGRCHYQDAIPYLQHGLPGLAANYPPGQINVVQTRGLLGLCLTRTGHAAEGEGFLRTALADGTGVAKAEFAHTFGNVETALGECLYAQGKYEEAAPLLRTGYDDLRARLGERDGLTVQAAARLHDLYLAWNKPTEAARYPKN